MVGLGIPLRFIAEPSYDRHCTNPNFSGNPRDDVSNEKTRTQKGIIFFGLFFAAVYFNVPSINYTNCLYGEDFRQSEFDGVIIRKYLDRTNHSTPFAELRNYADSIERISLFGDHSDLFDRVNSGDTLKKIRGTMEILKKVNNEFVRFGYANFNCDSVELEDEHYLFWLYDFTGIVDKKRTLKKE